MSKRYKALRRARYRFVRPNPDRLIGESHPQDGRDWDCQCARCGSSMDSELCGSCGGDGITGPGELYEEDPLWYDPDDYENCHQCGGQGAWMLCISSPKYCQTHPLPGRGKIQRHTPEWFTFEKRNTPEQPWDFGMEADFSMNL